MRSLFYTFLPTIIIVRDVGITALFPNLCTGAPTTISWTHLAWGVEPSTGFQTLFVEDCNGDPAQIWTVNET